MNNQNSGPDLSLVALKRWLSRKRPTKEYCYTDNGECLIAQFIASQGFDEVFVGARDFSIRGAQDCDLPEVLHDIAIEHPRTFGAALARTKAALSNTEGQS